MFGNRKLGYFEVPQKAFDHMDLVREILREVVILKAEFHFDDRCMHYFGICGDFEDVEPGMKAPYYKILCDRGLAERPLRFIKGDIETNWLDHRLYTCLTCHDEQTIACSDCNGSGEGMADGSKCHWCKGTGEVRCPDCGVEEAI